MLVEKVLHQPKIIIFFCKNQSTRPTDFTASMNSSQLFEAKSKVSTADSHHFTFHHSLKSHERESQFRHLKASAPAKEGKFNRRKIERFNSTYHRFFHQGYSIVLKRIEPVQLW